MNKYTFHKYSKNYKSLFNKEKEKLSKILKDCKIYHVGSTAIPNLGGKEIIEILITTNKIDINKKILEKNNYSYIQDAGSKERLYFEKNKINLHLTKSSSKEAKNMLNFVKVLRKNKKLKEKYENIKKQAVKYAKGNSKKYKKFKSKFFNNI